MNLDIDEKHKTMPICHVHGNSIGFGVEIKLKVNPTVNCGGECQHF